MIDSYRNGISSESQAGSHARVRVAVVETNEIYRTGLVTLLNLADGMECIGSWGAPAEAAAHLTMLVPDVVLVDAAALMADDKDLPLALRAIRCRSVVMTIFDCPPNSCECNSDGDAEPGRDACAACRQVALHAGADHVLRKQMPFDQIAQTIRRRYRERVARIRSLQSAGGHGAYACTVGRVDLQHWNGLTPREAQIVCLVRRGCSNKQIAAEMGVAYSTVKNYMSSILDKLNLEHRTQLAVYAASSLQAARG